MELGYGAGALGEYPWHLDGTKPWTDQDSKAAMDCLMALDGLGINWIDTARRYGGGKSEELIGLAIRSGCLKQIITKIEVNSPEKMRKSLEESVAAIGKRPDVLLLHDPDLSSPDTPDVVRWLLKQDATRHGFSSEPSDDLARWYDLYNLTAIEFPCSITDWRAERILAHWLNGRDPILKVANRTLGGPEKKDRDIKSAMDYVLSCRAWIDMALIGTTNMEHLIECVSIFGKIREGL